jgi:Asparagine synthase
MTDTELVCFMAQVLASIKLPGLRKKNIMRRAMGGILPPEILNKKKVGPVMLYSRWFKNEFERLDRALPGIRWMGAAITGARSGEC